MSVCRLFKSFGLPAGTTRAHRWLRVNEKIVVHDAASRALAAADPATVNGKFDENRFTAPQSGFYSNSLTLTLVDDNEYELSSYTVVGGKVEFNFCCTLRGNGKVLDGEVNTFAFGSMEMEQEYMDEYRGDWRHNKYGWDIIEPRPEPPVVAAAQ